MLQQATLPDRSDPKLWMVGCKDGEEMTIMIALVNKFIARDEAGERLGITSAVCTGKGRVFVEAHREAQVRGCERVQGCAAGGGGGWASLACLGLGCVRACVRARPSHTRAHPACWPPSAGPRGPGGHS